MLFIDTLAVATAAFVGLIALYTYYHMHTYFPEWEAADRGFQKLTNQWGPLFGISGAIGVFVSLLASYRVEAAGPVAQTYMGLTLGIVAFYLTFMGLTDLRTMKAPWEMMEMCLAFVVPLGLIGLGLSSTALPVPPDDNVLLFLQLPTADLYLDRWLQFLLFFVPVFLIWLVPGVALGGGDSTALLIMAFAITPVVGALPAFFMIGFAAVIQCLLIFILAPLLGWGRVIPDPLKRYRLGLNRLLLRMRVTRRAELIPAYNSRQTPLLPAIGVAFVVGTLLLV